VKGVSLTVILLRVDHFALFLGCSRLIKCLIQALEVRVPAQGVKAQWVKIELRKVETLPGTGAGNTFYDIIGPGTVTLWTSGGAEYEMLHAVSTALHSFFMSPVLIVAIQPTSCSLIVLLDSEIFHSRYAFQSQSRLAYTWNNEVWWLLRPINQGALMLSIPSGHPV
jgi:hypothetical protein